MNGVYTANVHGSKTNMKLMWSPCIEPLCYNLAEWLACMGYANWAPILQRNTVHKSFTALKASFQVLPVYSDHQQGRNP